MDGCLGSRVIVSMNEFVSPAPTECYECPSLLTQVDFLFIHQTLNEPPQQQIKYVPVLWVTIYTT